MTFNKSVNGYKAEEVDRYIDELKKEFESERKELLNNFQSAEQELTSLKDQKVSLTANLQSVRDSSVFFTSYEKHFNKTLHEAELEALEKIENLIIDQETFIETIEDEIELIDQNIITLKNDLAQINQKIDEVASSVAIRNDIDNQISRLNHMIGEFQNNIQFEHMAHSKKQDQYNVVPSYNAESAAWKMPSPAAPAASLQVFTEPAQPKLSLAQPPGPQAPPVMAPKAPVQMPSEPAATETTAFTTRPKTVLIAERDQDTAALLSTIMEREGYTVSLAADAYAVMNMTKEYEPFGMMIIDSMIPYIEINSLIKQIRNSPKWCDVPILVLSADQNPSNSISLLSSGANDFIEKPFNPRELVARVNRINETAQQPCMRKGG